MVVTFVLGALESGHFAAGRREMSSGADFEQIDWLRARKSAGGFVVRFVLLGARWRCKLSCFVAANC